MRVVLQLANANDVTTMEDSKVILGVVKLDISYVKPSISSCMAVIWTTRKKSKIKFPKLLKGTIRIWSVI